MSSDFRVRVAGRVRRALVEGEVRDLRWTGVEPPDPLNEGTWGVYRDRLSTRVITVAYDTETLSVRIPSGSSHEDCELGLDIVRRAAGAGRGEFDTEVGELTVAQLDEVFGFDWITHQLESAARICIHLARDKGGIGVPGPTREVWVGPSVVAELEDGDPAGIGLRLLGIMRRVLWPDPSYEIAAQFAVTSAGGESFTLAMLLPDRQCLLPRSDRLAIEDSTGIFMVPRSVLTSLPVRVTYLDDANQLVEAIHQDDWADLCRIARTYELGDPGSG